MREYKSALDISLLAAEKKENGAIPAYLLEKESAVVRRFHEGVPGYEPTPLLRLKALAGALGVKEIFVKDESKRFGLKAFKCLGALNAARRAVSAALGLDENTVTFEELVSPKHREARERLMFITATDGNHGKGVAWTARQLGCRAMVFMPKGTVPARAEAIRAQGARVSVTELCYDDTVRLAAQTARETGGLLIQDTAWDGYEQIPADITAGYTTMAYEAACGLEEITQAPPTHMFLQAGVGSMAAGVLGYFEARYGERAPRAAILEPNAASCIYASAKEGADTSVPGGETIMAGLNCGTPSRIAMPLFLARAAFYISCAYYVSARGMRLAANPLAGDEAFISGESGAAPLGALSLILERPELAEIRRAMGFDADSVILLFSTEGDTDPQGYRRVLVDGKYPSPFC